jgi:hypothetical protein
MTEQVKLQQALFGYRDGHNLMAASISLPPRVKQFLATVTDSSGPENTRGFEGALTGLPVPETDFYALFRTWPAPEMSRPGCVWSHLILIQLADLARVQELFHLGALCSRPEFPINLSSYEEVLDFDIAKSGSGAAPGPSQMRLRYLVQALYGHPEAGVVILDEEGKSWESAVFRVWSQQWPRLRRDFAFSTGSLGDRRLTSIPFDLQIAPVRSERLWRRSDYLTLLLNFPDPPPDSTSEASEKWADVAEDDLRVPNNRQFRQFLFDYGSDVERPRAGFGKLAAVYKQIRAASEESWPNLLRSVAEIFPVPAEAGRLKRWLVTLPEWLDPTAKLERAWSIVSFLLDAQQSSAYPSSDYDFSSSAAYLWSERREQAISLLSRLVKRDEQPAAVSFAEGIASAVDSTSLRKIAEEHGELVPIVIRYNLALASEVDTWRLSGQTQTQVYETLTKLELGQEEWGQIVGAMFTAATYVSVREAVAMAGPFAMTGSFRWLEYPLANEFLPSHSWRDALALSAIAELSRNSGLQPAQLALSAWCVPSNEVRRVLSADRSDVQRLSDASLAAIPAPLRIPTAFLLLTLGLNSHSELGVELILRNFFVVHDALASSTHSSESWWLLAPELPTLGWWKDWDHCKRLRRGTRYALAQRRACGRLAPFARTADERKIVEKFCEYERKS